MSKHVVSITNIPAQLSSSNLCWTWNDRLHPQVSQIFDQLGNEDEWYYALEKAPTDAIVGKILCVCVALATAREILSAKITDASLYCEAVKPLILLEQWIDDPTEE